jgi:membrane-bound lytic murein transglycosylase D
MIIRAWLPRLAAIGLAGSVAACGASNPRPQTPQAPPPARAHAEPPAPAPAPVDPIASLIKTSQEHYDTGERELNVGHLERARAEFDKALDVLLESPFGARTDPRLRAQFDRLVDRINAQEMAALAQGDGFSEKRDEPASIDELLKIATFPKPPAGAGTAATVRADLEATAHDVPIPENSRIFSYVELFQGRLHDYIEESLRRGSKYLPMIQSVFKAEGLPLDLAYIPIIESGFKTNALSKANAKGPWQFMKATAVEQGLKHDWYVDERSDPEKATIAAAKYLKTLYKLFDGDWHLVLAAYNGGLGRVQRAIKRAGTDDFWELSDTSRYLPKETREYVPLILAAIVVAKNPAQYGFDILPEMPIDYEKVVVPSAIDLRKVAEWTGQTIDEIQALNPELRRWTTPVATSNYEIKVPAGTAEAFTRRLADASPDELASLKWYTVRRGESIATIARKLHVSRADLAEANQLSTRSSLKIGQELVIPRAPTALLASNTAPPPPATVASRAISGTGTVPATRRQAPATVTYRVKRGDTLSSIARLYDTTVAKIKNWNALSGSHIAPGDRLKIVATRTR